MKIQELNEAIDSDAILSIIKDLEKSVIKIDAYANSDWSKQEKLAIAHIERAITLLKST